MSPRAAGLRTRLLRGHGLGRARCVRHCTNADRCVQSCGCTTLASVRPRVTRALREYVTCTILRSACRALREARLSKSMCFCTCIRCAAPTPERGPAVNPCVFAHVSQAPADHQLCRRPAFCHLGVLRVLRGRSEPSGVGLGPRWGTRRTPEGSEQPRRAPEDAQVAKLVVGTAGGRCV